SVPLPPPFALFRSLFFSRLPVSSFSSSQSNADGGEERGGEELSSRPVIRVSRSRTAGRNMHMMRRLKSIASGRSSVSDPGGDLTTKRAKFDQVGGGEILVERHMVDDVASTVDLHISSSHLNFDANTLTTEPPARFEGAAMDQLPREMHGMTIRDNKTDGHIETEFDGTMINGKGTMTGQILATVIGGRDGQPKQTISYMAERIVGTGSFGVVFQAKCVETGEAVAIKKVLQDKRYKNRELQIMLLLDHPNVVQLKHYFFSTTEKDEIYLNLVLEYVSETLHRTVKYYTRMNQHVPLIYVKLYTYQICRGLAYIHHVAGVCHRDIKPQNLLVNPHTHQLKLCDFGSAKKLVPGEPNISYICSRYYRAPELIFGATEYSTAIDMWSVGCVLTELLIGQPLFPGESGVDQLVEIIKILGTPTREEIKCMNPNCTEFKFPQIKAHPWHKLFHKWIPPEAVDLVSRLLQYSPNLRFTSVSTLEQIIILHFFSSMLQLEACAHPFFDELRDPNTRLPNGNPLPPLFSFTTQGSALLSFSLGSWGKLSITHPNMFAELEVASPELVRRLIPEHVACSR
ncbi:unnamed protein product, partial [Musa hybrid cultivar]